VEDTIWSVKDRTRKNNAGIPNIINFMKLIFLRPRGKRNANARNETGVNPDVANAILPQNNFPAASK
jgi:hypothetical protein